MKEVKKIKIECSVCHNIFLVYPSDIKHRNVKYCSRKCYYNSRVGKNNPMFGVKRIGVDNPNWSGGPVKKKCDFCGIEFSVFSCRSGKYCSRECHHQGMFAGGRKEADRRSYKKRILNPQYKIKQSISSGIRKRLFKRTLKKKEAGIFRFLPYTVEDLVARLELLFRPGMTWDNYGKWHIDHIIPDSSFKYKTTDDEEFKKCWALSNLQPLWARDNLIKSNKIL